MPTVTPIVIEARDRRHGMTNLSKPLICSDTEPRIVAQLQDIHCMAES